MASCILSIKDGPNLLGLGFEYVFGSIHAGNGSSSSGGPQMFLFIRLFSPISFCYFILFIYFFHHSHKVIKKPTNKKSNYKISHRQSPSPSSSNIKELTRIMASSRFNARTLIVASLSTICISKGTRPLNLKFSGKVVLISNSCRALMRSITVKMFIQFFQCFN